MFAIPVLSSAFARPSITCTFGLLSCRYFSFSGRTRRSATSCPRAPRPASRRRSGRRSAASSSVWRKAQVSGTRASPGEWYVERGKGSHWTRGFGLRQHLRQVKSCFAVLRLHDVDVHAQHGAELLQRGSVGTLLLRAHQLRYIRGA